MQRLPKTLRAALILFNVQFFTFGYDADILMIS